MGVLRANVGGTWVDINPVGPQGPEGPQGPQGPPGLDGTGSGGSGKTNQATLFIASSTAPDNVKLKADYVLSGANDQRMINEIIHGTNGYPTTNQFFTSDANTDWETSGATNVRQTNFQYGSVELSEGIFNLTGPILLPGRGFHLKGQMWQTVLYNAASSGVTFDITDTGTGVADGSSTGGNKGMIMFDTATIGANALMTSISDLYINCDEGTYQSDVPENNVLSGIYLYDDVASGTASLYGFPYNIVGADGAHHINNVRVFNSKHGFYWSSTNGMRGITIDRCGAWGFSHSGFYLSASDPQLSNCSAGIGTAAATSAGFRINAGNSVISNCKAFYCFGYEGHNSAGGTGFLFETGSRSTLVNCIAQDCYDGFNFNGVDDLCLMGIRADTQVTAFQSNNAINLSGCATTIAEGLIVQTRAVGASWTNGIMLPTGSQYSRVDGLVGAPPSVVNQVVQGGVTITSSSGLGANCITNIVRESATPLISSAFGAGGGGGGGSGAISADAGNLIVAGSDAGSLYTGVASFGTFAAPRNLTASTQIFASFTVVEDGTDSGTWPEKLQFHYQNGATIRHTGYFNEYGEGRYIAAKSNTVALRAFGKEYTGDSARNMTVPIFEVCDDRDNRTRLFGVFGDGKAVHSGQLTVGSGGAAITGTVSVTGNIAATGTITAANIGPNKVTTGTTQPSAPALGDVWVDTNP